MPSPQKWSTDLFRSALSFKFGFVGVLTDMSKDGSRSRSRDQVGIVRKI